MRLSIAAGALLCMTATASSAQDYPVRPITIVVPSAAGGLSDILARQIATKAADTLGGTIIVENRPGASGSIGGVFVMRSQPDGYTIMLGNGASHGAFPALAKTPPYDPIKNFAPIARVGETQLAIVASKKTPFKNAQELLSYARSNPGKLTYATFGHGSAGHLFGEVMKKSNGIDMLHVPYKGESAAVQALVAGEVDLAILVSAKPYVDQGLVTLIGSTSPNGSVAYPDWPTMASQDVKGFSQARGFQAFLAPVGTPQPIIDKLAAAFAKAIADPDLKQRLLELGVDPANEPPHQFPEIYRSLVQQWQAIVVESGVTTN